jgi:hypothetical protein
MLTIGAEGFDSLLLPLAFGALLIALIRVSVSVCSRATEARDARAIARASEATKNVTSEDTSRSH